MSQRGVFREGNTSLWVEKYRPKNFDEYIGNKELKDKAKEFIKKQDISNLLLEGPAGTGKSSLGNLLVKEIECDFKYINASNESGIETVRTTIMQFCITTGFSPLKVLFLDECLDENTLVTVLRKGKIENIKISELDELNDLVKSFNEVKNIIEWRPFNLFFKGMQDCYELEFENGENVVCTASHKWFVRIDGRIEVLTIEQMISKNIEFILTI